MKIKCPICEKEYQFQRDTCGKLSSFFPFCSKRCQLIDLGKWLDNDYKIESELKPDTEQDFSDDY